MRVINVARGGVLVESDVRLTPGSGLCLNMAVGDQLYQVAGRVSRVDAALVSGRIKYQAGVALDQEMAIFDLPAPQADGSGASDGQRSDSAAQLAPQEEEADPDDSDSSRFVMISPSVAASSNNSGKPRRP